MDLAILVPVLGRPHRVAPLLRSIERATPDAVTYFVADPDDADEQAAIIEAEGHVTLLIHGGNYARKINYAIEETNESLVFLGADDLDFHPGWFEGAMRYMERDRIEVVGVNDLCSSRVRNGNHATHFLVARSYCERGQVDGEPGLLCEEYEHNCTDDELVHTSFKRGVLALANDVIVEHCHPDRDAGRWPWDETYGKGRVPLRADRRLLRHREKWWT